MIYRVVYHHGWYRVQRKFLYFFWVMTNTNACYTKEDAIETINWLREQASVVYEEGIQ